MDGRELRVAGRAKDAQEPASEFDALRVPPAIRTAMRILELEQGDAAGIEVLAGRVGLSPAHFSRQFAAGLGPTSAAYGCRIRLDHVVSRLLFDPAPLGVVAQFGFDKQPAFNRAFRRQHGASPSKLIQRLRQAPPGGEVSPAESIVRVVERPAEPALARRFFGPDFDAHWRRFIADLPPTLVAARRRAGLLYDLPAVTPARHQRYDCAIPIDAVMPEAAAAGLDAIELPGGLHAEVSGCTTISEVTAAIRVLYGRRLRAQSRFAPEGDPMVHWTGDSDAPGSTATIRLRRLIDPPTSNLMPLDAALRPIGRR